MVRGWIYSIIGAIVFLFALFAQHRPRRDPRLLPPARKQRVRGAPSLPGRDDPACAPP